MSPRRYFGGSRRGPMKSESRRGPAKPNWLAANLVRAPIWLPTNLSLAFVSVAPKMESSNRAAGIANLHWPPKAGKYENQSRLTHILAGAGFHSSRFRQEESGTPVFLSSQPGDGQRSGNSLGNVSVDAGNQ